MSVMIDVLWCVLHPNELMFFDTKAGNPLKILYNVCVKLRILSVLL